MKRKDEGNKYINRTDFEKNVLILNCILLTAYAAGRLAPTLIVIVAKPIVTLLEIHRKYMNSNMPAGEGR
jgi:hypothetical protein